MELGLTGKVALVMGASRGLGRAAAAALAADGATVAAASRSAESVAEAFRDQAGTVHAYAGDTGDLDRMRELVAQVIADHGQLDILVTNTGGPAPGGPLDHELDEWEAAYRSLVLAPAKLIEAALPGMTERGWGRIVNVGSTTTIEPNPGLSLSNTHRAATVAYFKTLAREVAAQGITVNTVATGRFATDRLGSTYGSIEKAEAAAREEIPAGRLGRPDEYGALVAFLCSERAAYLTGTVIPLDGGMTRSI